MFPRFQLRSRLAALRPLPFRKLPAFPLLPTSCALCGSNDNLPLCTYCHARWFDARPARCACCAVSVSPGVSHCGPCIQAAPAFDATLVASDYTAPIDQLVLALKFGGRLELAPLMANLLRGAIRENPAEKPALLVPVPLGDRRLVERGFNQALEIARPLATSLGLPVARAMVRRTRDTQAQSLLHPDARRRNVTGAFALEENANVRGLHVGVVDDVMTTGETLNALASIFKQAGAARVTNLVFARTLPA